MIRTRDINRPNIAVASFNGIEIDMHIGHARRLLIYGPDKNGRIRMLGTRDTPEPGGGGARWKKLAETLDDCFALLASGAGPKPVEALEDHGIAVFITEGNIRWSVDTVFSGGLKVSGQRRGSCCRHEQPQ